MQIKFLQKKPYYIFVIENFLNDNEYNLIDNNFPNVETELSPTFEYKNRRRLANYDKNYKDLKDDGNLSIKVIEEKFNNKFFIDLIKKLKKEIFISRLKNLTNLSNLKNLYAIFRKIKIVDSSQNKTLFQKIFQSNYQKAFDISYMYNNSYITPHTDKTSKLLSLMLYFPTKNLENIDIGTTFYHSKLKNFSNKEYYFNFDNDKNNFLAENEDDDFFNKNFKETITFPFKKKDLYCFIKSDTSWHSVKKLNIPDNEVRKSININLKT